MSISAILPLVSTIFVIGLAIFVFSKHPRSKLHLLFSFLCSLLSIWLFSTFMMFVSKTDEVIIWWDRFVYAGVVFIPAVLYHFGLVFSNIKQKKTLLIGYILSFVFLILSRTDYFVSGLYKYSWGIHTQAKLFHHIFLIYFFIYVILFFLELYRYYKTTIGIIRSQTKYIFLALLAIALGSVAYLPAYGIDVYPVAYLSGIIGVTIIAYAIIRYRLMDIRLALSRGAVYFLSFATIIALGFFLMFLNDRLSEPLPFSVSGPLVLVFCVALFQAVFRFYQTIASKHFYYTFYSYQKVLTDLSRNLTHFLDIDKLSSLIVSTLINTMKLDKTIILIRNPETKKYHIQKNIGFKEENGISLVRDNFLTQWLEANKKLLVYEELISSQEKEQTLKQNMKRIQADVCLPLFHEEKIYGIIVLGRKISGDPYSQQDIDLLINLSNQASIALQNANLYDQVQDLSQNLQEKVDEQVKELKKAYEELKKLDTAKSEFISMASHQLRTPLTAIKGYLSLFLEGSYGPLTSKGESKLKNSLIATERLIRIINTLLDVSKIELGKMELQKETFQIDKLIESILEELEITFKKNVKTIFHKPKKALPKINADQLKIREIIFNLVDNAIRYTKQGKVEIKAEKQKSSLLISVKDTGEGLSKEEQKDIFNVFTRGHAGIDLFIEGTGLGLYISKKFADLHKGKLWVESPGKGKGSTFYVELPIKT